QLAHTHQRLEQTDQRLSQTWDELVSTHGRLEDALRLLDEQAQKLRATEDQLAGAQALATALQVVVEGYERLGYRPLSLLRRWARFRDKHPKLMSTLRRVMG